MKSLPSEEEILAYIRERGGSVTNMQMYGEKFGDVGRGNMTIKRMRKMTEQAVNTKTNEVKPLSETTSKELGGDWRPRLILRIDHMRRPRAPEFGVSPSSPIVETTIRWMVE